MNQNMSSDARTTTDCTNRQINQFMQKKGPPLMQQKTHILPKNQNGFMQQLNGLGEIKMDGLTFLLAGEQWRAYDINTIWSGAERYGSHTDLLTQQW